MTIRLLKKLWFWSRAVKFCFTKDKMPACPAGRLKFIPIDFSLHGAIPPLKAGLLSSIFQILLKLNYKQQGFKIAGYSPPLAGAGGGNIPFFLKFHPLTPASGGNASCKFENSEVNFNLPACPTGILPLVKQNLTALSLKGKTSCTSEKSILNLNLWKIYKIELSNLIHWERLKGGKLTLPTLLLILLSFFSCTDEPVTPIINNGDFTEGVFITNEGLYPAGNASVTFYKSTDGEIQEKIFSSVNNQPLGDVLQSMAIHGDKTYLVVNNSDKIEVVNTSDFSSISTIENLGSPRHIQIIDDKKAYVSDLYAGAISVVNLATGQKTGTIPIGGSTEEMIQVNNEIFVTQPSLFEDYSNQLFVINTVSDKIVDSITVGYNPSNIQIDRNNQLWVMCNGDREVPNNFGGLYRINPSSKQVDIALPFNDKAASYYPRLAMNGNRDKLYFLKLAVYSLPVNATALPTAPIIESNGRDIYGLGIHPTSGQIYIGDSGNFVQKGTVTIHDETGQELSSFKAGVGVNGFYFN